MIRIAITPAAFEAIAATLALGMVAVEPERDRERGAQAQGVRGPGESYSDVILRVAKGECGDLMTTH